MRHLTCDPNVELIGQTVLAFRDNLNKNEIIPYLEAEGLVDLKPDQWYPAYKLLNVLNELGKTGNMSSNYVALGMSTVEKMVVPPEMEALPLEAILNGWDDLYHLQHRGNADIGSVSVIKINDKHFRTVHHHIYPDDMTYGVAYGLAKRWLPRGTHFTVMYDQTEPNLDNGGSRTIIDIMWE